ncbi:tyrosine-type recombinase/integrase [Singulisphaera sp. PoT]|uniref:tyrosine-type recombinase/integrase n=1 Tax=Singulisphaera sp. PoT TaxID=3411797 RepID=UPI003BF58DCB
MASIRRRGRIYYYRYVDASGVRVERKGCSDKKATQEMARAAESEAAQVRSGTLDPKAAKYREHEARPLVDHLADFERSLLAKGDTAEYVATTRTRVAKTFERAGTRRISAISLSKTIEALAGLRKENDWTPETQNHHVRAVKGFSRWLWRDGRTREHALAHLATVNSAAGSRRRRRALTVDECRRLLVAAHNGPVAKKMTGPVRSMMYDVAMNTGFRAAELGSLTVDSFDLTSERPRVTVKAAYTKNKHEAVMPLPPALAARLREWLPGRPAGEPVFRFTKREAEMLRVDLAAAGIPYETPAGRADFHSLRGVFISNVVASGASVKTAQTLARHSTPSLTIGIYAKASVQDIDGAVNGLPELAPQPPPISDGFAPHLPHMGDAKGQSLSQDVAKPGTERVIKSGDEPALQPVGSDGFDSSCRTLADNVEDCRQRGIDTHVNGLPMDHVSIALNGRDGGCRPRRRRCVSIPPEAAQEKARGRLCRGPWLM